MQWLRKFFYDLDLENSFPKGKMYKMILNPFWTTVVNYITRVPSKTTIIQFTFIQRSGQDEYCQHNRKILEVIPMYKRILYDISSANTHFSTHQIMKSNQTHQIKTKKSKMILIN